MNKRKEGFTPTPIEDQASHERNGSLNIMCLLEGFIGKRKKVSEYNPQLVSGFTLIELLIVAGIMLILAAVVFSNYAELKDKRTLETEADKFTARVREVMERSRSQADGEQWGVHLANPSGDGNDFYEVWKGSSYASSTITEKILFDSSLKLSNPADNSSKDLIFVKATGLPAMSSTIVIQSLGGGGTATINIDSIGRIDYSFN